MERKDTTGHSFRRIWLLAGMILAVLLLLSPHHVQAAGFKAKGIDVSRWQGKIDWEKVKKDGIEFVMIGVGRYQNGVGIPDTQFDYNMKNAIAQGIHVGVYLYSEATTEEAARAEADFVLDQIDGYKISYPVAFDIEDDVHRALTTKKRTDITIAFLEVIEEAGYYPMIYASQSWLQTQMDLTRLTKYDKWVARWADTVEFKPTSMWQYSSTGTVKGITGAVDLDYSYTDYSKIITPRTKAEKRRTVAGWKTDGTNYWYVYEDGTSPKQCFAEIDGSTYYFNKNGYRVTGWKKLGGKYYYFVKKTGVMKTGWMNINGTKYYLDPKTGVRQTGWITVGKKKYYLSKSGVVQKGWKKLSGSYYYFDNTGAMQTGLTKVNGQTYYLSKKTGKRLTGWRKLSGKWYYFGPRTGAMQKNVNVGRYKLGDDGVCLNKK